MKKLHMFILTSSVLFMTACQSNPHQYNGTKGYQVETQTSNSATLTYTLAVHHNQQIDQKKLQQACKKVLGTEKNYKISILSMNEIMNPTQAEEYGIKLGNSRAKFGLSNAPNLNNSEGYATHQALDTQPATLKVVRYTCS